MKLSLLFALLLLLRTHVLDASPVCMMTALYDTHAVSDTEMVWRRGVRNGPVTELAVDKRTGQKSFCIHGGSCYLAAVTVNGHAVEALRMATCRIQKGDSGYDDGDSITYGLEGVPATASGRPNTDSAHDVKGVRGWCNYDSHTASGAIEEDITDRRKHFECDTAAFTFLDDENKRIRIVFFDSKHIKSGPVLGFEGIMLTDGETLKVSRMYYLSLESQLETTDSSVCGMSFKGGSPTSIICYGASTPNSKKYLGTVNFVAGSN